MTAAQLSHIMPAATSKAIEIFLPHLNEFMPKYEIVGRLREAAFIAQLAHESCSFKYTREIASGNAYEGRKDLGNIYKGDGTKFRGRGLIQITGRTNYHAVSMALYGDDRLERHPELLQAPAPAVESACWYWKGRKLNELADTQQFTKITKRINGGLNGIKERFFFYHRALAVLE